MNDDLNAYPETDMFGREIEGGKWAYIDTTGRWYDKRAE